MSFCGMQRNSVEGPGVIEHFTVANVEQCHKWLQVSYGVEMIA